ncbi:hypothetical protein V7157_23435 [Neobacillus drentensis]|uniref:hypothetical protein n=1 Tax=Neobacillus drentensis TaxID=220684 RepID=UPI003002B03E
MSGDSLNDIIKKHEKKEKEKTKATSKSSENKIKKNIFKSDMRTVLYDRVPYTDIKVDIKVNNKVKIKDNKENMVKKKSISDKQ